MKIQYFIILMFVFSLNTRAHDNSATATYLGNEGVMIENGESKIIFDPFFHNNYSIYQWVPDKTRKDIFSNKKPYDGIDVIFISHAHGDHFSAEDVLQYLKKHPHVKLIAPSQATEKIMALEGAETVKIQMISIGLKLGDKAQRFTLDNLLIEVVRIPHAGWPARADVSNLVFRVTLDKNVTIMHMGDADPSDQHFKPYKDHWLKNKTNTAFPPYWFFISEEGPLILEERINSESAIGIHVPVKIPASLRFSDERFFSKSGETAQIGHKHDKPMN